MKPKDVEEYALGEYALSIERDYAAELSRIPLAVAGASVLDLAGGPGTWTKIFAEAGARRVVWTDRSIQFLSFARRYLESLPQRSRIGFAVSDLTAIPFQDGTFDIVYCRLALHHSIDEQATLNEISRVLRSGGVMVLIAQRVGLVREKVPPGVKKPLHYLSPYLALLARKKYLPTLYHLERPLLRKIAKAGMVVEVCDTSNRASIYVVARKPVGWSRSAKG